MLSLVLLLLFLLLLLKLLVNPVCWQIAALG